MKVRTLIIHLSLFAPDAEVFIFSDSEGNTVAPLSLVCGSADIDPDGGMRPGVYFYPSDDSWIPFEDDNPYDSEIA